MGVRLFFFGTFQGKLRVFSHKLCLIYSDRRLPFVEEITGIGFRTGGLTQGCD
jgi:hypothetical protein